MINVLMIGVDEISYGGMLTVANYYKKNSIYNKKVNLLYVATATRQKKLKKILFFIKAFLKILLILVIKEIDIVHIHMAEKTSVYRKACIIKVAKLFQCKVIVHLHAGPFINWYNTLSNMQKKFVKRVINEPDKFLVLGQFWTKQFEGLINDSKIGVLYNGIYCPDINSYNENAKDIAFLSFLRTGKGIYDLLETIEMIREKIPSNTKFHLCGLSDEFDISEYLESRNLTDIVEFHGWIDDEKKKEIFNKSAACILPTYVEGLSMTVLESMSMGIPMITTNVTTMPELLGGIIDLIEPGDKQALGQLILELLYNPQKRSRISELEFTRVKEHFSDTAMIERTLEIYEEIS